MTKTSEANRAFAVCVRNAGYEASLELHKIYALLPDAEAEKESDIRVIDESGEDYLYPADWSRDSKRHAKVQKLDSGRPVAHL